MEETKNYRKINNKKPAGKILFKIKKDIKKNYSKTKSTATNLARKESKGPDRNLISIQFTLLDNRFR